MENRKSTNLDHWKSSRGQAIAERIETLSAKSVFFQFISINRSSPYSAPVGLSNKQMVTLKKGEGLEMVCIFYSALKRVLSKEMMI